MNNERIDWNNEKIVFFFGAGASKPEGGIVNNQLLEESLKQFPGDTNVVRVKEYIKNIYHNDCESGNIPLFEEVLGPIDIALQKQESLSFKWNSQELSILRNHLIYCICKVLDKKLLSPAGYHEDFIENLLGRDRNRWSKCSFISLNYDILLDNALMKLGNEEYPIDLDYGIRFRNEKNKRREGLQTGTNWYVPRKKKVLLLKLHGSLNWLYCPTCNSVKITPKEKGVVKRIYNLSEKCDSNFCNGTSEQRPIVVPPTYTKAYDNPFLVSIWLQAERVLQNATRVYFIGYSMPEADIHVQYLLKKSLFRQDENSPRIIIINPDKSGDVHARYKRLFGEVTYHQIGFEEFSRNLTQYL